MASLFSSKLYFLTKPTVFKWATVSAVVLLAIVIRTFTNDDGINTTSHWNFTVHDERLTTSKCHIDVMAETELTVDIFLRKYWRKRPLILQRAPGTNAKAHEHSQKERLLQTKHTVRFTTYQSYAFESNERRGSLVDYISHWKVVSNDTVANTSFAFGEDAYGLGDVYIVPKILTELRNQNVVSAWHYQTAVAASGAGLQWHWHADVFAETLQGKRKWLVAPPGHSPIFSPRETSLRWFHTVYQNSSYNMQHSEVAECNIGPNEAIYVPADFFHATISLGEAVSLTVGLADTYRNDIRRNGASDHNSIDPASLHHIQMLDAFGAKDFPRAIALGQLLVQERPQSFVPWAWMGVIYTVYAQSMGRTNVGGETLQTLLNSAREASSQCTRLNPLYAPCHTWLARQLGALALLRGGDSHLEELAISHRETAALHSSIPNDDEILDPRWRPRSTELQVES